MVNPVQPVGKRSIEPTHRAGRRPGVAGLKCGVRSGRATAVVGPRDGGEIE